MTELDREDPAEIGRINMLEVVAYSATIILIGLLAVGWFSVMLPWG